jgi:hypothetical protein
MKTIPSKEKPVPGKAASPKDVAVTNLGKGKSSEPITIFSPRVQTGLILSVVGLFFFVLGARPSFFGEDRSPVIGFVQIAVFEFGLGLICLGGYIALKTLSKNQKASIPYEFGVRFIATGFAISIFCGLADLIGIGSHRLPLLYFGPLQSLGLLLGQGLSALGLMMLIPFSNGSQNEKFQRSLSSKSS